MAQNESIQNQNIHQSLHRRKRLARFRFAPLAAIQVFLGFTDRVASTGTRRSPLCVAFPHAGIFKILNMKKYIYQFLGSDEMGSLCDSIEQAIKEAKEAIDGDEGKYTVIVWDARPATEADADLFEFSDEVDTILPLWWQDMYIPENEVQRIEIQANT
jgi:hypothetical protein